MYNTERQLQQFDIRAELGARFTGCENQAYLVTHFQKYNPELICNNTGYRVDGATKQPFLINRAMHQAHRLEAPGRAETDGVSQ
jgi:hypothetical protein